MRSFALFVGNIVVLTACSDPPCGFGERKVGSTCVELVGTHGDAMDAGMPRAPEGETDPERVHSLDGGHSEGGNDHDASGAHDSGVADAGAACAAVAEVCDGVDNDCDTAIDEGATNACGECGPERAEDCSTPADDDCDGQVNEGCCVPSPEACDGLDNDCDGVVDNGIFNACGGPCNVPIHNMPGAPCSNGLLGACQRSGRYVCAFGRETMCNADRPAPGPCLYAPHDGIDNDCDGEVDEVNHVGPVGPGILRCLG